MRLLIVISFCFLAALLCADALSEISSSSEAREVLVAQTISSGGNWLTPTRHGVIASKPPLLHWISAGVPMIFGADVTLWSHRSVSSFFSFCIVLLVVFAAHTSHTSPRVAQERALMSTLLLILAPGFIRLAMDARVDMAFSFFTFSAVFFFIRSLHNAKDFTELNKSFFLLPCICMGLACLTKGPLGIFLPLFIGLSTTVYVFGVKKALGLILRPRVGWLFVILGPAWYLAGALATGNPFIERHLFENISRLTGESTITSKPAWFYLETFLKSFFPWSLLFGVFLVRREVFSQNEKVSYEKLYLMSFLAGVVFFSLSSGKRNAYLLPLLPLFILYFGFRLQSYFDLSSFLLQERVLKGFEVIQRCCFILMILTAIFLGSFAIGWNHSEELSTLVSLYVVSHGNLLVIIFLSLFASFYFVKDRLPPQILSRMVVSAVFISFIAVVLNGVGMGLKAEFKGFHRFAAEVNREVPLESSVVLYKKPHDERFDILLWYLQRPVSVLRPDHKRNLCYDYQLGFLKDSSATHLTHETLSSKRRGESTVYSLTPQPECGKVSLL